MPGVQPPDHMVGNNEMAAHSFQELVQIKLGNRSFVFKSDGCSHPSLFFLLKMVIDNI